MTGGASQRKAFSFRDANANGMASLRATKKRLNNRRFCTPTKQENLVVQQFLRRSESPTVSEV
ncbi:hypothetical protein A4S05_31710 [Nostoc sp. KVJ20]|nr:hypothetical protein A4S05_31710 [Nostoc sp. KVJ20]